MKLNKYIIVFVALILTFSITAFGNEAIEMVKAYLVTDVNFEVDGEQWMPKDVDGSPLTPLNYMGRTYVPVRSLLEDKGVTVGYEDETRTVLIDYSTMKPMDKASPLLMQVMDGGMEESYKELTIEKNPNLDLGNITYTQDLTFDLSDETMVYTKNANGEAMETSLKELATSEDNLMVDKLNFEIDKETGMVSSVVLHEEDSSMAMKIGIEVEISGPPFKIKITIKF